MRRLLAPLACIALLSACSPSDEPTPSPTPSAVEPSPVQSPTPVSSPAPTPTPSPTPTAFPSYPADLPTEDPETAAIIKGWQEYWRVYEKFVGDPLGTHDLSEVQAIATGDQPNVFLRSVDIGRERRVSISGGQQFRDVVVGDISSSSASRVASMTYCADSSAVTMKNVDTGESVKKSTGDTYRETVNLLEGTDGVWRVSKITNEEASC